MYVRRFWDSRLGLALATIAIAATLTVIALPVLHALGDPGHAASSCQLCILIATGALQAAAIAAVIVPIAPLPGIVRQPRVSIGIFDARPQLSRGPPNL